MPEFCKAERDGRILTVTMNRPEVMNSLHPMANVELGKVFDDFVSDPDLWVAIITGAGERAFSAGNDLKFQAAGGKAVEVPKHGFGGLTSRFDNVKPVIAAVNGVAMGGGFEIALACDVIIASDNAVFALPEPRVGLAALAGGVHRLPRQIGLKNAMGMLLTGRRVSAVNGALRAFENFNLPQISVFAVKSGGIGVQNTVENEGEAVFRIARTVYATDIDLGITDFRSIHHRYARGQFNKICSARHTGPFQRVLG